MDEVYWGCYRETAGEMRLVGAEAVLPPEVAALPAGAACAAGAGVCAVASAVAKMTAAGSNRILMAITAAG